MLLVRARATRPGEEIKGIQVGNARVEVSVSANHMQFCLPRQMRGGSGCSTPSHGSSYLQQTPPHRVYCGVWAQALRAGMSVSHEFRGKLGDRHSLSYHRGLKPQLPAGV